MNIKYCQTCGNPCNPTANICPRCGTRFQLIHMQANVQYVARPQPQPANGFGITGMVLGIIAVCFSWITLGGPIGVFGLIFSAIGMRKKYVNKGTAIAGLVLNIIAILIAGLILSALEESNENASFQTNNTPSNTSVKPAQSSTPADDGIIDIEYSGCTLKYLRHEFKKNYADEDCLVIYYQFTNNSDETKSYYFTFSDQAFQNGVELDKPYYSLEDEKDNRSKDIKPGASVEVYSLFEPDDKSNVELEVDEYISFDNKKLDVMQLSLE